MSAPVPPRVLVAINTLEIGGAERQVLEICRALGEREFRFDVVTTGEEGPLAADLRRAGARVHSLRVGGRGSGRARRLLRLVQSVSRYRSLLEKLQPDLIHAYLPEMSVVSAASRWPRRRPPLVVSKRTLVRWMARDPIYFPIARWINRRADVLLANSEAVRQDAIGKEGADPERIRVIHNGVNTERFSPGPSEEALARQLGLPPGVPVIGMVANFFGYKGHADVVDAAAILRGRRLPFTLLFVGREGDASEGVRRRVREAGLTESVLFSGPCSEVPDLLRLCDVYVSASHEEGFSNSILEAMASGLAIVATSVGGTPEQIDDNTTGLLVPPGDPERLAAALSRLLQDGGLRSRLAAAAREDAVARFSLERLAESVAALYRDTILGKSGPRLHSTGDSV
jgi:glycosyltransferase involved in cell wall biosynthesis